MNYNETDKFEFLITLNSGIIVQRFFNVKNYNPKAKNSVQIYEYIKYLTEQISTNLKNKNAEYMLANQKSFKNVENEPPKELKYYKIELKFDGKTFHERIFPSNIYHPEIKLDIRENLNEYLTEIIDILSMKNKSLNTKYLNYNLNEQL